jgi:hypothetical protein
LRAYQSILPQLRAAGARLIAVSAQTPDNSLTTAEKHALESDVLSDAGNVLARSYGLVFRLPDRLRPYYDRIGVSLGVQRRLIVGAADAGHLRRRPKRDHQVRVRRRRLHAPP